MSSKSWVDVWHFHLNSERLSLRTYFTLLSGLERERALQYRTSQLREQFILKRGLLRQVLSLYLGKEPWQLEIEVSSLGKPFLKGHEDLHFNLSDTDGVMALAVSESGPVGIDIEKITPDFEIENLMDQCCSQEEQLLLTSLPEIDILPSFFRLWTLKESCLKALGSGLYLPLKDVHFTHIDHLSQQQPFLWKFEARQSESSEWKVFSINGLSKDYCGSLATVPSVSQLREKHLPLDKIFMV